MRDQSYIATLFHRFLSGRNSNYLVEQENAMYDNRFLVPTVHPILGKPPLDHSPNCKSRSIHQYPPMYADEYLKSGGSFHTNQVPFSWSKQIQSVRYGLRQRQHRLVPPVAQRVSTMRSALYSSIACRRKLIATVCSALSPGRQTGSQCVWVGLT